MKYRFNEEHYAEIKAARRATDNKRAEKRLEVLQLRCEGKTQREISEKTGFNRAHVGFLIKRYFEEGLQSITENRYGRFRQNMSYEEETEFLEMFKQRAEQGEILDIHEIEKAYQESRS